MGQGARDIGAVDVTRRVSPLGLFALLLALVGFPIFKVQFIDHHFTDGGIGWAAPYIGAELAIAVLCLLSLRVERRPRSDVGLTFSLPRLWWWTFGVAMVIAAFILALRHFDALTITPRPGADYGVLAASTTSERLFVVAGSAIGVPLEEVIWRGFAVTRLRRLGAPTWLAMLVPSVAFAYFHGGTVDTILISIGIGIAVLGLSYLFVRTRSLAWPILLHFGWNVLLVSLTPA